MLHWFPSFVSTLYFQSSMLTFQLENLIIFSALCGLPTVYYNLALFASGWNWLRWKSSFELEDFGGSKLCKVQSVKMNIVAYIRGSISLTPTRNLYWAKKDNWLGYVQLWPRITLKNCTPTSSPANPTDFLVVRSFPFT